MMDELAFEKAAKELDDEDIYTYMYASDGQLYATDFDNSKNEGYLLPTESQGPAQVGNVTIHTKTTKSFGVKALKNDKIVISNIIYKNEDTPCTKTKLFGLAEDDQETANIEVYESTNLADAFEVDQDYFIGNAILELPKGLKQGSVVEVTMNLSNEGTLSVTGKELTTNQEVMATFASECIMEETDVEDTRKRVDNIVII